MPLRTAFGNCRIRWGIEFLRIDGVRVIDFCSSSDIHPRQNVECNRHISHITFLIRITGVAICDPIRVLHTQVAALTLRPVLHGDLAGRIPTLENLYSIEVVSAREEISWNQRITIHALIGHILILLHDIIRSDIYAQAIFQKVRSITECKIIAIIGIVWNDSVRINNCCWEKHLVLVRSSWHGDGVGRNVTRFEKIFRCIPCTGSISKFFTPTINRRTGKFAITTRAITVLKLGKYKRLQKFSMVWITGIEFPGLSLFCRDHNSSICSFRTVKCCGWGSS